MRLIFKKSIAFIMSACFLLSCTGPFSAQANAQEMSIRPVSLKTDYMAEPLGISYTAPRFSWELDSLKRAQTQTAYRIEVKDPEGIVVWDSQKVLSSETLSINYNGEALLPRTRYTWRVKVWDKYNVESSWSDNAWFETGMADSDWADAAWIQKSVGRVTSAIPGGILEGAHVLQLPRYKDSTGTIEGTATTCHYKGTIRWKYAETFSKPVKEAYILYAGTDATDLYINGAKIDSISGGETAGYKNITKYILLNQETEFGFLTYNTNSAHYIATKIYIVYEDTTTKTIVTDNSYGSKDDASQQLSNWKCIATSDKAASWTDGITESSIWMQGASRKVYGTATGFPAVNMPYDSDSIDGMPYFRREFSTSKEVSSARAHISGLGNFNLYINGDKVGDNVLDQLTTDVPDRFFYTTFDVTDMIENGDNAIGVELSRSGFASIDDAYVYTGDGNGDGDGDGIIDKSDKSARLGTPREYTKPILRMKLYVKYSDGTEDVISTDTQTWKCNQSPTIFDNKAYGEAYDARLEQTGWNTASFDDSQWTIAEASRYIPAGKLEPQTSEACKIMESFKPVAVWKNTATGSWIFDIGKEITGWVSLNNIRGKAGDNVTVHYSEWVKADEPTDPYYNYGSQYPTQFLSGKIDSYDGLSLSRYYLCVAWPGDGNEINGIPRHVQSDYYTFKGDSAGESWEPSMYYKGFQFVELKGLPDDFVPTLDTITAKAVYSGVSDTGIFESSDPVLNSVHNMARYSLLCNMHDFISDTPVYEDQGYLGDGAATQHLGMYNFGMEKYYEKWMYDIIGDLSGNQEYISLISPFGGRSAMPTARAYEWSAAIAIIPWTCYELSGNLQLLKDSYDAMLKMYDYFALEWENSQTPYLLPVSGWGDHAARCTPNHRFGAITANCYSYYSICLLAKTAELLGYTEDAIYYSNVAENIKEEFNKAFWDDEDKYYWDSAITYKSGNVTYNENEKFYSCANILPLALGLVPEENIEALTLKICDSAFQNQNIDWGIFSNKYVYSMLTEAGYGDVAYKIATGTDKNTQYGYWVKAGYNTLTENMRLARSRSHHMWATIDDWMYNDVAGLRNDGVAFSKSIIKPHIVGELTYAKGKIQTVRGELSSHWQNGEEGFKLDIVVPVNTTSTVYVPAYNEEDVTESGVFARMADGVSFIKMEDGYAVYSVGSGTYSFHSEPLYTSLSTQDISSGTFTGGTAVPDEYETFTAEMSHEGRLIRNVNQPLLLGTKYYVASIKIKPTENNANSAELSAERSGTATSAGYTIDNYKSTYPLTNNKYVEVPLTFRINAPQTETSLLPQVHIQPKLFMNNESDTDLTVFKDFEIRELKALDFDSSIYGTAVRGGNSVKIYLFSHTGTTIYYLASDGDDIKIASKVLEPDRTEIITLDNVTDEHKLFLWNTSLKPLSKTFNLYRLYE